MRLSTVSVEAVLGRSGPNQGPSNGRPLRDGSLTWKHLLFWDQCTRIEGLQLWNKGLSSHCLTSQWPYTHVSWSHWVWDDSSRKYTYQWAVSHDAVSHTPRCPSMAIFSWWSSERLEKLKGLGGRLYGWSASPAAYVFAPWSSGVYV